MKKTLAFALLCALVLLFASCALDAKPPAFTVELYEGSNPVSDEYLSFPVPEGIFALMPPEHLGALTREAADTLGEFLYLIIADEELDGNGFLAGNRIIVTESQFESIVGHFSLPAETTVDELLTYLTADPDSSLFEKKDSKTLTLDVNTMFPKLKGLRLINVPDDMTTEEIKETMEMMLTTLASPAYVAILGISPGSILNATISDDGLTATFLESFIFPVFDAEVTIEDGYILTDPTDGP